MLVSNDSGSSRPVYLTIIGNEERNGREEERKV